MKNNTERKGIGLPPEKDCQDYWRKKCGKVFNQQFLLPSVSDFEQNFWQIFSVVIQVT